MHAHFLVTWFTTATSGGVSRHRAVSIAVLIARPHAYPRPGLRFSDGDAWAGPTNQTIAAPDEVTF